MNLTLSGFAMPRVVALRGKGGNRARGDNGVSSPTRLAAVVEAPPATRPAGPRTADRAPAAARRARAAARRPAALEWRDLRLPLVGRLSANAWLPSILLAGCLVALMYLLQMSGVATTGYDIQNLQAQRDDWVLRNEQLQLELAKRRSLTWIEAEAVGRLGMVRPEPTALTYVKVAR